MKEICRYCKHRKYGKINGSSDKIHYCKKAKRVSDSYGIFTQGARCIYDTDQLSDLFEPISMKEELSELEKSEERVLELRREKRKLEEKIRSYKHLLTEE